MQRARAAVDADGFGGLTERGEVAFERRDGRTENELRVLEDLGDRGVDLGLQRAELRGQIDKGNHAPTVLPTPTRRPLAAIDSLAASSSRTTRSPASPSVVGLRALTNALDEVRGLDAERFGDGQLRRPHVAGAVPNQHLIDVFRAWIHRDATVVDLDLLAALEVVEHYHAATAAQKRPPHLHRRQPVHVHVRDQTALEEHRHVGDVLGTALADARGRCTTPRADAGAARSP